MRASAGSHRTFLYVRVSTHDQAEYGTSLDGQRDLGAKFCADQGYADPQVRVEVESAGEEKIERRKELRRILSEIRSGDVLVCRDLSRWSRDQVFAVHSVRQMRAKGSRFDSTRSRSSTMFPVLRSICSGSSPGRQRTSGTRHASEQWAIGGDCERTARLSRDCRRSATRSRIAGS